ncbi:MAG: PAQR family membrane homeostasis protein TrhA [Oscillospiraceae bacterium]
MPRTKLADRKLPAYSLGEERFNAISHLVGFVLGVVGLVLAVVKAAGTGDVWNIVSAAVYGGTLVVLYLMSTLYHGLKFPLAKRVFQIIDHCAIFLLIAGTYTPLTLCALRPDHPVLAWAIFGVVWAAAIVGITLNAIDLKSFSKFSMICYIAMGWCIVLATRPLLGIMKSGGLWLLLGGGVAYTVGAVLYALGKKKHTFMHGIFHVFVVLGSVLHYFCIYFYCL